MSTSGPAGARGARLERLFLDRYRGAPERLRRARAGGPEGAAILWDLAHDLKGTAPLLALEALGEAAAEAAAGLDMPRADPRTPELRRALDRLETTLREALEALKALA